MRPGDSAAAAYTPSRSRWPREGQEPPRILVVDDDPQTLRYVRDALEPARLRRVRDGRPAGDVRTHQDAQTPTGFAGSGAARNRWHRADAECSRAGRSCRSCSSPATAGTRRSPKALDAGAADYIVKPFSPTELTARVRAALRRRAEPEPFLLKDLAIHYDQRLVTLAGRPVELTATEYELLRLLALNAGRGDDLRSPSAAGVGRVGALRLESGARPS